MNWSDINTLLSVIHQAAAAGPKFQPIVAAASEYLLTNWAGDPETPAEEPVDE